MRNPSLIGVIGLGRIACGMAARLTGLDHPVAGFDISADVARRVTAATIGSGACAVEASVIGQNREAVAGNLLFVVFGDTCSGVARSISDRPAPRLRPSSSTTPSVRSRSAPSPRPFSRTPPSRATETPQDRDPEGVDRRAKADQAMIVERNGDRAATLAKGPGGGGTPALANVVAAV